MRRGASAFLLALFALMLFPVLPAGHGDGCACPGGSCRCNHTSAEMCGSTTSTSGCAMDTCEAYVSAAPFPAVILREVTGLEHDGEEQAECGSGPRTLERSRDVAIPPPRAVAG